MMNDPYEPLPFLAPGDDKKKYRNSADERSLSTSLSAQSLDDSICANNQQYLNPKPVASCSSSAAAKNNLYHVAQCSSITSYHIERQYNDISEPISNNRNWPAPYDSRSLCHGNDVAQSRNETLCWHDPSSHFNDACASSSTPATLLQENQVVNFQTPLHQTRGYNSTTRQPGASAIHLDPQGGNTMMPPSLSSSPFPFQLPTPLPSGLASNAPSNFPFLQGRSTSFLPPPDNSNILVSPKDKEFATQFSFGVLSQMRVCTFNKIKDFRAKRKGLRDGYSGLACKWCYSCPNSTSYGSGAGAGKFFPSSIKTVSTRNKLNPEHYCHDSINVLNSHQYCRCQIARRRLWRSIGTSINAQMFRPPLKLI